MTKTERLSIKLLPSDKAALDRLAQAEGEAAAVVVRRLIRRAAAAQVDAAETQPAEAQPAQPEAAR